MVEIQDEKTVMSDNGYGREVQRLITTEEAFYGFYYFIPTKADAIVQFFRVADSIQNHDSKQLLTVRTVEDVENHSIRLVERLEEDQ